MFKPDPILSAINDTIDRLEDQLLTITNWPHHYPRYKPTLPNHPDNPVLTFPLRQTDYA